MANDIFTYKGKTWEVLSDCGDFYVAKVVNSDRVENVKKDAIGQLDSQKPETTGGN